jgi:hypothetical protein
MCLTRDLGCRITLGVLLTVLSMGGIRTQAAPVEAAHAADNTIQVGVAKIDITPKTPVRMYGYASRKTESEGIAGALKASALVLDDESDKGPAVMLTVDCGSVPQALFKRLLKRLGTRAGIQPERFVLCHSHCHSGPDLKGMNTLQGQEKRHLEQYAEWLLDQLEAVVLEALAKRTAGRLDWTQGSVKVAANRRIITDGQWTGFGAVPEGAVDHSLPLLRVTDTSGRLLAVVINYACHNTTLRGSFMQIHGDWAGCAQANIEANHPGTVCLISLGCGADSDPYPHGTVALCEQHGQAIAQEVDRLLEGPFKSVAPDIRARARTLHLPRQTVPPIEELKQRLDQSWLLSDTIKRVERGESVPSQLDYRVVTWCFGDDLAMVFLENEVVVDYALRMKQTLAGDRLWITAYTNDVSTYVVSRRLIAEGGYEVNNSLSAKLSYGQAQAVDPTVEDRIVDTVRELLPAAFHASPP